MRDLNDAKLCRIYAVELENGYFRVPLIDGSFEEACYNDHSLEELRDIMESRVADINDCRAWGITPGQWHTSIQTAVAAKIVANNDGRLPIASGIDFYTNALIDWAKSAKSAFRRQC